MRKFKFSLSALLEVCFRKEEIAQNKLKEAHQELKKNEDTLRTLILDEQKTQGHLRQVLAMAFKAEQICGFFEYLAQIKLKVHEQKRLIKEARLNVEQKRQLMLLAMQQRKILENLKEKKYMEWQRDFDGKEQKFFDELSSSRGKELKSIKF